MRPGEIRVADGTIVLSAGRRRIEAWVTNTADRPIGVGSHFPIAEANAALVLDREAARGMRLDVPSGEIVWFAPRARRSVTLVDCTREEAGS